MSSGASQRIRPGGSSVKQAGKILQIIPAPEWYAVYWIEPDETFEDAALTEPIACFALMSNGEIQPLVCGPDGMFGCPETEPNFIGYYRSELPEWMTTEARKTAEMQRKREQRLARAI